MDLCLQFRDDTGVGDSSRREASREQVEAVLAEAREKHLVPRPFRDEATLSRTDGICFCCDDCCAYFLDRSERCDKGAYIERTDMADCTDCGACVPACYFGARAMADGTLQVKREECYGCGLCLDACPEACISLEPR